MTRGEYLIFERASAEKHEFHDGELFPVSMAGAKRQHNRLTVRIGGLLDAALQGRPCEVYSSDMKVRIPNLDRYKYPDLSVACSPVFEDEEDDILINPTVLFEVLSPSTQEYDRQGKFEDYTTIPTLRDYVLIAQDRMFVEHRTRQEGGWFLRFLREGDVLKLASVGVEIPIADIYRGVFTGV